MLYFIQFRFQNSHEGQQEHFVTNTKLTVFVTARIINVRAIYPIVLTLVPWVAPWLTIQFLQVSQDIDSPY